MNIISDGLDPRVNEKLLSVVTRQLNEGRRHFGSAGASLTYQVEDPKYRQIEGLDPELSKIGLKGERRTSDRIREWMKDKPSAVLIDSIRLELEEQLEVDEEGVLEEGDTDHTLIVGNTVLLIDSKAWKSKRRYNVNDKGEVLRADKPFPGGKVRITSAMYLWDKFLKEYGAEVEVQAMIVIAQDEVFAQRDRTWWRQPFRLIVIEEIEKWLDKFYSTLSDSTTSFISADLVALIASNAVKPYNAFKEQFPDNYHLLKE